jgi:hypothetical protein
MHLFVYYKFDAKLSADVMEKAQRLQTQLLDEFVGLKSSLLKRPDIDVEGLTTWMEAYETNLHHHSQLQDRLAQIALSLNLPTPRHTEVFVDASHTHDSN